METIKSYSNLEQSRKLAEILPLESADMGWNVFVDDTTRILPINDWDLVKDSSGNVKFYHAWSLAALLDVLPDEVGDNHYLTLDKEGKEYCCCYEDCNGNSLKHLFSNNPVDACYEMIIRLNELNLL